MRSSGRHSKTSPTHMLKSILRTMSASTAYLDNLEIAPGVFMPLLGFGTYQLTGEDCQKAVLHALNVGYRHIDTAAVYRNEADVAAAIKASKIPRSELFITSKLQAKDHGSGAYDACIETLKRLDTDYLDCYLVHWPGVAGKKLNDPSLKEFRKETWLCFQRLHAEGKCRSIGVSNYMPMHLEELCAADWCTVKPAINQFELHPLLQQREAVRACRTLGVAAEAYSSLARGAPELMTASSVTAAAAAHGKSASQVVLRWALQHGYVIIPKSANPARIEENAGVFGWRLSDEEMKAIDALDCGHRTCWDPTTVLA